MMNPLASYVLAFILTAWWPQTRHGMIERVEIAEEISHTDASPLEALTLANVAAFESGFERTARGKLGEVGAWQNLHGDPSARAALRLLRLQGIVHFMGFTRCTTECERMADHRTFPAELYSWSHDPPRDDASPAMAAR
jgi:hypothetical protein